ncbi:hypothetical protein [Patulibacter minatonensis]|uniref:hypothetical protein n=1 Tax=Patulibacter minatonensis TaxID=298163 RepID=UPI0012FCE42E|nr:hypothetical protein [Patulibacter minatonensis]
MDRHDEILGAISRFSREDIRQALAALEDQQARLVGQRQILLAMYEAAPGVDKPVAGRGGRTKLERLRNREAHGQQVLVDAPEGGPARRDERHTSARWELRKIGGEPRQVLVASDGSVLEIRAGNQDWADSADLPVNRAAILEAMHTDHGRRWTPKDVHARVRDQGSQMSAPNVRVTMQRMAKSGQLVRIAEGEYVIDGVPTTF